MAKKGEGTGVSVEFTDKFELIGTITKVETFESKGGGLNLKIQVGDRGLAQRLINSVGAACSFVVGVSAQRADDMDEGGELGFDDLDEDK